MKANHYSLSLEHSFGVGLFVYQSLDAIDGKQARRTGTSGPLGELFDHGKKKKHTHTHAHLHCGFKWTFFNSHVQSSPLPHVLNMKIIFANPYFSFLSLSAPALFHHASVFVFTGCGWSSYRLRCTEHICKYFLSNCSSNREHKGEEKRSEHARVVFVRGGGEGMSVSPQKEILRLTGMGSNIWPTPPWQSIDVLVCIIYK